LLTTNAPVTAGVIHKKGKNNMQYKEAVTKLKDFLASDLVKNSFGVISAEEVFDDNVPIISKENVNLPKDGVGHKSGVYFIYTSMGEIYYIGKATKDNLHEEVWGKLKTPSKNEDNTSYYPKNYFLNNGNLDKNAVNEITTGNVKVGVLVISNSILSSLAEVYLQTIYCHNNSNNLPKLNSQIG